jgi:hypothetical protein
MAKVGIYPVEFTASIRLSLVTKTEVTIDTFALGLRFDAGTTYTVELEEGFVKETGANKFDSPAVGNLSQFTTNSTGPQIQQDEPSGNAVTNNTFIRYTYDRQILAGNGNYELYKVGSPDTLLRTYNPSDSTANNTISSNQITLDVTGLIDAAETYYVLIDEGAVEDRDGLPAFGFDNDQEHRWTTAPSTNVDFPDLTSLKVSSATLTCEAIKRTPFGFSPVTHSANFTSNFGNNVTLHKGVNNLTSRTYDSENTSQPFSSNTPTVSPYNNPYVKIELTSPNGEFGTINSHSTTYTIQGTITSVNASIGNIYFWPDVGYNSDTSFNWKQYHSFDSGVTYSLMIDRTIDLTHNQKSTILNTYTFTSTSDTYTPTAVELYYCDMDYAVIGAGGQQGSGVTYLGQTYPGNAGGGGGDVKVYSNQTITNKTYQATAIGQTTSNQGGATTFEGATATGGYQGVTLPGNTAQWINGTYPNYGGRSGNNNGGNISANNYIDGSSGGGAGGRAPSQYDPSVRPAAITINGVDYEVALHGSNNPRLLNIPGPGIPFYGSDYGVGGAGTYSNYSPSVTNANYTLENYGNGAGQSISGSYTGGQGAVIIKVKN